MGLVLDIIVEILILLGWQWYCSMYSTSLFFEDDVKIFKDEMPWCLKLNFKWFTKKREERWSKYSKMLTISEFNEWYMVWILLLFQLSYGFLISETKKWKKKLGKSERKHFSSKNWLSEFEEFEYSYNS